MPLYFLPIDADLFHQEIVPALSASWKQRRFAPCRPLCDRLRPAAQAFLDRYGPGSAPPLVCQDVAALPFGRAVWKYLVGEILLYSVADLPDLPTAPDTLACLVGVDYSWWIEQAHFGSRDLVFGRALYHPGRAALNNRTDVDRLTAYLASIDPDTWTADALLPLTDLPTAEDRAEELAFARECLDALRTLYAEARRQRQVVVCENLEA